MIGGGRAARVALGALSALSWAASAAPPVRSEQLAEASAFLQAYRTEAQAQSAAFYDLYSDRAVIHASILNHADSVAFAGHAFKAWGRQRLSEGQGVLEASVFHDITVEEHGNRLLIRAKRYSTTRCYWDASYQVLIARSGPVYQIVEEHLTNDPASRCAPAITPDMASQGVGTPAGVSADAVMVRAIAPAEEPWHPLSQQELASQAMQLARSMPTPPPSAAAAAGESAPPDADAVAQPHAYLSQGPARVSSRLDNASDDPRLTPAERP